MSDLEQLKLKGKTKVFQRNKNKTIQKIKGAMLISDKVEIQSKDIEYDKGHFLIFKAIIQHKALPFMNIHAPNNPLLFEQKNIDYVSKHRTTLRIIQYLTKERSNSNRRKCMILW